MSWRTDGPGSFTCQIETRTLARYGLNVSGTTTPLKGRWLWYEHPTAGGWGGVITRTEVDSWYTTITAEQFAVLLRKRRMPSNIAPQAISPGSLALFVISSAERTGDSFMLTSWTAQECGPAVDLDTRGGDICDEVIPQLADYGYQWRVKATTMQERAFEFRNRVGEDKSRRVLLSEGRNIPIDGVRMTGDLWTVANSIIGVNGDTTWGKANGYQLDSDASIRALGRRYETTIAYNGFATRSTIIPLVKKDLAKFAYPREIAEVQVSADDQIWGDFREGDIVMLQSGSLNVLAPFEVDIRSLDMGTGMMTIAGRIQTENAL
jgi:hypothetical protein